VAVRDVALAHLALSRIFFYVTAAAYKGSRNINTPARKA
jgi:hypothetical protein